MTQVTAVTVSLALTRRKLQRQFRQLLADSWKDFRKRFKRCQARFSESSVHQVRVEARRLQALLGLLEIWVGQEPVATAHRRIKKVLRRFARLRDTQVLLTEVERRLKSFPEAKPLRKALRARERRLIRRVGGRIRRARLARIKSGIITADREARRVLAERGRRRQHWEMLLGVLGKTVARVMFLRERCRADDVQSIHQLRLAFKRFRYTVELLQPVLTGVTQREIRKLRAVQNRLGAIQDADVLVATIDKFVVENPEHAAALHAFRSLAERRRDSLIQRFLSGPDRIGEFRLRHPAMPRWSKKHNILVGPEEDLEQQ